MESGSLQSQTANRMQNRRNQPANVPNIMQHGRLQVQNAPQNHATHGMLQSLNQGRKKPKKPKHVPPLRPGVPGILAMLPLPRWHVGRTGEVPFTWHEAKSWVSAAEAMIFD